MNSQKFELNELMNEVGNLVIDSLPIEPEERAEAIGKLVAEIRRLIKSQQTEPPVVRFTLDGLDSDHVRVTLRVSQ